MLRRPMVTSERELVERLTARRVAGGFQFCYLSGPMTGLPDFNVVAFERATDLLRTAGWFVKSPHEHDAGMGVDLRGHPTGDIEELEGFDFKEALRWDLRQVIDTDMTFVMPGWEHSIGAQIEVSTALAVGRPVCTFLNQRSVTEIGSSQEASLTSTQSANGEEGRAGPSSPPPTTIPLDSAERKALPLTSGVLDYFPAALAAVAVVSRYGNDKHNPGEAMHHARGKSMDHADSIARHLIDRGYTDPDTGQRHSAELAWRALAMLQQELEDAGEAPLPRGARL